MPRSQAAAERRYDHRAAAEQGTSLRRLAVGPCAAVIEIRLWSIRLYTTVILALPRNYLFA